jgi:hypothetical protein
MRRVRTTELLFDTLKSRGGIVGEIKVKVILKHQSNVLTGTKRVIIVPACKSMKI